MRCTASRNLVKLGEPTYDSSPRIIAAHCSVDIANAPESVSRSIRIASEATRNKLYPAVNEFLTFFSRGPADRLDALDPEWLDDGSNRHALPDSFAHTNTLNDFYSQAELTGRSRGPQKRAVTLLYFV
jgi:hypothetical protein